MTSNLKKILIIGGVAVIAIAVVLGIVLAIPSDDKPTTTTTTTTATTTTTKTPDTTTTTTTTKNNDSTTTTTTKPNNTTTTKPSDTTTKPAEHVHTPVTDPEVLATCTATGLTEGLHCSDCGKVLVAQTIIPMTDHTAEIIPAVPATCKATGFTEGKKCSVCGNILEEQSIIPMTFHTYDDDKDDTCNVCGYVRDLSCKHANTEIIPAVAATCSTTGLTEGKKCSDCGEILEQQITTAMLDHTAGEWIIVYATCTVDGWKHRECTVCHTTIEAETISKTGHNYTADVTAPTCTSEGYTTYTCSKCGDSYKDDYTSVIDHNYEMKEVVSATCSSRGYTVYVCSECGDCKHRDYTDQLPHTPGEWIVTTEPTREEEGERYTDCTVCGGRIIETIPVITDPSDGLQFTKNSDGESYSVSGIGECKDTVITIPSEYRGLPVTAIADRAFYNNSSIKKVILPDTVVEIGNSAFANCKCLYTVELSENLKTIGDQAFQFSGLVYITLPASLESINADTFSNCVSLVEVCNLSSNISDWDITRSHLYDNCKNKITNERNSKIRTVYGMILYENGDDKYIMRYIKDSDTFAIGLGDSWLDGYEIYSCAFYGNTTLKTVSILCKITAIGDSAFEKCTALERVTFTESVKTIGARAFAFTGPFNIYYQGTADEWNAVEKNSFWDYQDSGSITIYVDDGNGYMTPLS